MDTSKTHISLSKSAQCRYVWTCNKKCKLVNVNFSHILSWLVINICFSWSTGPCVVLVHWSPEVSPFYLHGWMSIWLDPFSLEKKWPLNQCRLSAVITIAKYMCLSIVEYRQLWRSLKPCASPLLMLCLSSFLFLFICLFSVMTQALQSAQVVLCGAISCGYCRK